MYISRIYIKNYRNFEEFDLYIPNGDPLTIIGSNNAGKTNLLKAVRLVLDSSIPYWERRLSEDDFSWSSPSELWSLGDEIVITITFSNIANKEEVKSFLYSLCPKKDGAENSLEANISFVFAPSTYKKEGDFDINDDYMSFLVAGRHHPSGYYYSDDGSIEKYDADIIKDLYACDNIADFYKYFYLSAKDIEKIRTNPSETFEKELVNQMYSNKIRKHVNLLFLDATRDVKNDFNNGYNSLIAQLFRTNAKNSQNKKMTSELTEAFKSLRTGALVPETEAAIKEIETRLQGKDVNLLTSKAGLAVGTPQITLENIGRYFNFAIDLKEELRSSLSMNVVGLGYQNLAYISAIFTLFELKKEIFINDSDDKIKIIYNLLLIEEPEAHLDVQNQKFLHTQIEKKTEKLLELSAAPVASVREADSNKNFAFTQVIQTSHSTHLASKSDLKNIVVIEKGYKRTKAFNIDSILKNDSAKYSHNRRILKQYLDATRSALLFARKIVLVEGLSEKYSLGTLINYHLKKTNSGLDLIDIDSEGIEIVEVGGKNFQPFSSLYSEDGLRNKCLILNDGDIHLNEMTLTSYSDEYTKINPAEQPNNSYQRKNIFTFEIDTFFIPNPDDDQVNNLDYLKLILYRFMKDGHYFKKPETFALKIGVINVLETKIKDKTVRKGDIVFFFDSILAEEVSKPSLSLYLSSLLKAKLLNDSEEVDMWNSGEVPEDDLGLKSFENLPEFIIPKYISEGLIWLITKQN